MSNKKTILMTVCTMLTLNVWALTFTVSSTADAGAGTLRQAIDDANSNAGADVIEFSVSGTITLASRFSYISEEVLIDGYTAPGYAVGVPSVRVIGVGDDVFRFQAGASNSTIRGLEIRGGAGSAQIRVQTSGVTIHGNWLGSGGSGAYARWAIRFEGATNSTIGGINAQQRNVIFGAERDGIHMRSACDNIVVSGNYVGTEEDGITVGSFDERGIYAEGSTNITVGGTSYSNRNIVGGATQDLIAFRACDGIIVKANFIGLAIDGSTTIGAGRHGLWLGGGSLNGTVGGSNLPERNYAAGNGNNGLSVDASDSMTFTNNYSGVDSTGLLDRGNGWSGLSYQSSSVITATDNLLSGNTNEGIYTGGGSNLIILGNIIGLGADGTTAIQNGKQGIAINNSTAVTIGGTSYSNRNIISSNNWSGIELNNADGAVLKGNFIGVDINGVLDRGNGEQGIKVNNGADNVVIGGSTDAERNIISGNNNNGIEIDGSNTNTIENNYIGTDSTGNVQINNGQSAIAIQNNSGTIVQDNILSGNNNEGIWTSNSDNNDIFRNLIGVALDGSEMGNGSNGIQITNNSNGNEIGGSIANANTIAYNGSDGVSIRDGGTNQNLVTFNSIHCNVNDGIDLQGGAQSGIAAPTVTSTDANTASGTGGNGNTIHLYMNIITGANCNCEGEIYIGSTTVDGSGNWILNHNLGLHPTIFNTITATQTDGSNNTSEFSGCVSDPMPVSFAYINASIVDGGVEVSWASIFEVNNDVFLIQKSIDGVNFYTIGYVDGAGTTQNTVSYNYLDEQLPTGTVYYQIVQVDYDGTSRESNIVSVNSDYRNVVIFPNPTTHNEGLLVFGVDEEFMYSIVDMTGREVASGVTFENSIKIPYELAAGSYILKLRSLDNKVVEIERFLLTSD